MRKFLLIVISFAIAKNSFAQDTLVVKEQKLDYKCFIVPVAFITTGFALKSPKIQANLQESAVKTFGVNFKTKIDDYIQFAPVAQALTGNLLGFKSKHGYRQIMANLAISNIAVGLVTFGVKSGFKDLRPDGSAFNSFSSGHTATAFNNAIILFLEYKDSNIWYASSGFAFATTTGVLRLANNRHWAGDVVAGAGIGIAIATIVTYWNPFNFDKAQNKKFGFIGYPMFSAQYFCQLASISIGLYFIFYIK